MKSWKKLSVIAGVLVVVGAGAAFGYEEFYDEKNDYKNYVSNAEAINSTAVGTDTNTDASTAASTPTSQPVSAFSDVDGKVIEVTEEKITVDVPLQGEKTFTIDQNTKIENFLQPLKKGSLVDIEANGELAYKIEAEKTIDAHGTIVAVTEETVTINYNGTEQSFKKAANFHIDSDGYVGAIEGLPSEFSLNENYEMIDLEIEIDD